MAYVKKRIGLKKQVTNILILGQTGVGKSTWINGISNYFQFESLDDACKKSINVQIPTCFYHNEQEIKFGKESKSEIITDMGQSATQKPKIYTLNVDGKIINLIDTPGIGDTRGTDKDMENFNKIMADISCMKNLDAICILLKSNESRLNLTFKYCIQELLIRLHTSVKNNILFCFTHSRCSMYSIGDTLPILNKMLSSKNIGIKATHNHLNCNDENSNCFCFDNEPFRYLVCVKKGITFTPEMHKIFVESWNKAKEETIALFKKVDSLVPHNVADTISVNQARTIIIALSKPMGECLSVINDNIKKAEDIKNQIQVINLDIVNVEQTVKFTGISLLTKPLDYPITVCTHKDCIEYVRNGKSQTVNTHYKTICHDHCYLEGIPTQVTNYYALANCNAFSNGPKCKVCLHTYDVHMHITWTATKIEEEFISEEAQKLILAKKTKREQIEELKVQTLLKVKELQNERETISLAASKFGAYLAKNALIAYNDVFGEYVKMMIKEEEEKEDSLRSPHKITNLKEILVSYEEEKKSILDAIKSGSNEKDISPEDINNLKDELVCLKYMGKTLKNVLASVMLSLVKIQSKRKVRIIGKI